jgi:prolyl-tRNA synthetase
MYLSKYLGKTLRQPPADAHLISHQLLVRAGYVRGLGSGQFGFLPLGHLALARLRALIRGELLSLGAQGLELPLLDAEPAETLVRLVRREVDSYRQLPVVLFQMAFRAMPLQGSRAGLFGAGERPVVEIQLIGGPEMDSAASELKEALDHVLATCDVPVIWATGAEGEHRAEYLHSSGDEEIVHCPGCGYASERSWAATTWSAPPDEPELVPEEIATPGCDTIAGLADFLDIAESRTLKMVFYSVDRRVTCVVIRGDRAVDEGKLARLLGTDQYYASLEDELAAIGAVGGYASPIGLDRSKVRVVADPSVRSGKNFVSGANRPDYHVKNVNVPRDFTPGEWIDLAQIEPGDPCPDCGRALEIDPAFALVHAGAAAPCEPEAEYLDQEGRGQPLWMATWGVDLGRLLAAVVEEHHDDYGIIWPAACAPLDVHLVVLDGRKEAVVAQCQSVMDRLVAAGFTLLTDDRDASAGVKFNDADLIGLPLRLTISKRSAGEDLVEAKWRDSRERLKLDSDGLAAELARL